MTLVINHFKFVETGLRPSGLKLLLFYGLILSALGVQAGERQLDIEIKGSTQTILNQETETSNAVLGFAWKNAALETSYMRWNILRKARYRYSETIIKENRTESQTISMSVMESEFQGLTENDDGLIPYLNLSVGATVIKDSVAGAEASKDTSLIAIPEVGLKLKATKRFDIVMSYQKDYSFEDDQTLSETFLMGVVFHLTNKKRVSD